MLPGAEVAQSASRFILATRNDTLLHALIQQQAAGHGQTRLVEELRWLQALSKKEHKTFSQNTEDGAIVEVFRHFGTTNKLAVEFGAENGTEVNSRQLWEQHGWRGVLLDGDNEVRCRSCLLNCYNMSGTDMAYCGTALLKFSGTDMAYGGAAPLRDGRYSQKVC